MDVGLPGVKGGSVLIPDESRPVASWYEGGWGNVGSTGFPKAFKKKQTMYTKSKT